MGDNDIAELKELVAQMATDNAKLIAALSANPGGVLAIVQLDASVEISAIASA